MRRQTFARWGSTRPMDVREAGVDAGPDVREAGIDAVPLDVREAGVDADPGRPRGGDRRRGRCSRGGRGRRGWTFARRAWTRGRRPRGGRRRGVDVVRSMSARPAWTPRSTAPSRPTRWCTPATLPIRTTGAVFMTTLTVLGSRRDVWVLLPRVLPPNAPLVLGFHGTNSDGATMLAESGARAVSDAQGVVFIAPTSRWFSETGADFDHPGGNGTYWETANNPNPRHQRGPRPRARHHRQEARPAYNVDPDPRVRLRPLQRRLHGLHGLAGAPRPRGGLRLQRRRPLALQPAAGVPLPGARHHLRRPRDAVGLVQLRGPRAPRPRRGHRAPHAGHPLPRHRRPARVRVPHVHPRRADARAWATPSRPPSSTAAGTRPSPPSPREPLPP
jgi:hypothetical protein